MDKYGFVYIWFDRKHRRFYIGSHWGTEQDGYICSSRWMRKSYKRRPIDFKRRVIAIVHDRKLLLEEEHRWLSMIPKEELGRSYYNLTHHKNGHWAANSDSRTVAQKISDSHKNDPNWGAWWVGKKQTDEHRQKHSKAKKGRRLSPSTEFKQGDIPWHKGTKGLIVVSDETKRKIGEAGKGRVVAKATRQKLSARIITDETREKLRQVNLGKHHSAESKLKMSASAKGKVISEETRKKIGEAGKGRRLSDEARKKISEAQKGVNNDPRSVKIELDGGIYSSIRSAAKGAGRSYQYVRKHGLRVTDDEA